jgi:nitroreductase
MDAREYHRRSSHTPEKIRTLDVTLDPDTKPRPTKLYRNLERRSLAGVRPPQTPALSAVARSRAAPVDDGGLELDRETLATLCYEASGIVERATVDDGRKMRFRAASCTGKLYHVDLYPVVGDVPGLDAGVYHFDPAQFTLDVLREGDYRGNLARAVGETSADTVRTASDGDTARTASGTDTARTTGTGDDPGTGIASAPVTFVATSTWWRNAWKYRERTYRHAFWDTGTILANLLASAHAMDHDASAVVGFADDPVVELLGVDPGSEAPIALAPVGSGSPVPGLRRVSAITPATEPVSSDRTEYPAIQDAWRASRLADGSAAAAWRGRARDAVGTGQATPGDGDRVQLDPVDAETQSKRPLAATVRRRGSCREYDDEGPSRRQVATVLDRALRGTPGDWNGGVAAGLAFNDCYVLATGVQGLADGSYQYHPGASVLERLGDVTLAEKRKLALDQPWAGSAHVNVYLLADVDATVDRLGNRGYRLAQLEAGITLGRLYLAAYAHRRLGGTGLTFFDDLVTDHLSPRARGQTPTCLFAFGRSA